MHVGEEKKNSTRFGRFRNLCVHLFMWLWKINKIVMWYIYNFYIEKNTYGYN